MGCAMESDDLLKEALLAYARGDLGGSHRICTKILELGQASPMCVDLIHKCRIEDRMRSDSETLQRQSGQNKLNVQTNAQIALESLLSNPKYEHPRLERYGSSSFSQSDDDGIISEIFKRIGSGNKTFFEFGSGSIEGNTANLFFQGWKGVWLDGDPESITKLEREFSEYIRNNIVKVGREIITVENVNQIIEKYQVPQNVDLLSIDIDGNDYHVWSAMDLRPRVLVIEYNSRLQPPSSVIQNYDPNYYWRHGGPFVGASLQALTDLSEKKGMTLVGTSISGTNAYFVRSDLVENKFPQPATAAHLWNPPRFHLIFSGAWTNGHPMDISLACIQN